MKINKFKKRAVIVHCWEGYPEYCWYPQTKKELEAAGFEVFVPAMPETDNSKLSLWFPKLQEVIGSPNENLYLIGHSIGCATILRYLESLEELKRIGGVVLVAGYTDKIGFEEIKSFFMTPFDFKKIKSKSDHFVAIHSDDDPYVDLKYGEIFKETLGAEIIIKPNMKHFSGPIENEESCLSLPEVTQSILKMMHEN